MTGADVMCNVVVVGNGWIADASGRQPMICELMECRIPMGAISNGTIMVIDPFIVLAMNLYCPQRYLQGQALEL